jgi:hypothetical protein
MATGMYDNGKAEMMGGDIDLVNDAVSAILVDLSLYTPDLEADLSLADIPEAARIAETLLIGKTIDVTTFRADDALFNSVTSDATVTGVVVLLDANTFSDSTLLCLFDSAASFPITPDGTDITVQWDAGTDGIFRL